MYRFLVVFSLLGCWQTSFAGTATVAVATNFKPTLERLVEHFHNQGKHRLTVVSASTGVLYHQLQQGARFDVFLSADQQRPQRLEQSGLGIKGSRFTYAQGRLALAFQPSYHNDHTPDAKHFVQAIQQLSGKLAIANPKLAPYGVASQQTLEYLKMWPQVQHRLVRGANIGQTYQYIASANATLGFVAVSQLLHNAPSLSYWPVPEQWHAPILQQAILLQSAQDKPAALAFVEFLRSKSAVAIIRQQGYHVVSQD